MKRVFVVSIVCTLMVLLFLGCIGEREIKAEPTSTHPTYFANVREFGARGDGSTLDASAINAAIDACVASGGGIVYFPPGSYLSGSIRMKSNVTLYLGKDATILGAPNDINAYDPPERLPFIQYQDFGHSHWHNSLIWGENLENIGIIGPGTIDGGGMSRGDPPLGGGDKTIALKLCRNILIKDIKIEHAGHFAVLPTGCDHMIIDSVSIDTNRDGINLDGCHEVVINNCRVNSPLDDAIVPKSSYALGYNRLCENITIANCYVSGYDEGSLEGPHAGGGGTGRIKFGTESNGGFKNVNVYNCVFDNCWGLALEIVDGGTMDNLTISNIVMKDVKVPIFIRLGNRARGPKSPPVGKIRNISISNVTATGADERYGSIISGIPGFPIGENIRLDNISITYKGGGKIKDSEIVPPEKERGYPEPSMFGEMPSYGFYCRHARGVEFHNVRVGFEKPDRRAALIFDDVEDLELCNLEAERAFRSEPPIILNNAKNVIIRDSLNIPPVKSECGDVRLSKNRVFSNEPFSVTVNVKSSEKEGLNRVRLLIDGETVREKYVWLKFRESKDISFHDIRLYEPGKHEIRVGDSVKILFVEPTETRLKYYDLSAFTPLTKKGEASTTLMTDENSVIKIKVKNVGSNVYTEKIGLNIDDTKITTKDVTLKPGEDKEIEFEYKFQETGYHKIGVGKLTQSVYVWNAPGKFVCTGLETSKGEVFVGEPFAVWALLTDTEYNPQFYANEGSKIDLCIDGKLADCAFVMAKKGEEKRVNFNLTLNEVGKHRVSIGKMTTEVTVQPRPVSATFKCVNLVVSPGVFVNKATEVVATIKNLGLSSGAEEVEMYVDGELAGSKSINILPGETKEVSFTCKFAEPGEFEVTVGHLIKKVKAVGSALPEHGLLGEYFNNMNLSGEPVMARIDEQIDFDWGSGSPAEGTVNLEQFSVRWTGKLVPPTSKIYRFYVTADDGVRLYIDGKLIIDGWYDGSSTEVVSMELKGGCQYDVRMEYYEHAGEAVAHLRWG